MSGDLPKETQKIENTTSVVLTAAVSMDVYVPQEAVKTEVNVSGGVNGFVQEYYAPKSVATNSDKHCGCDRKDKPQLDPEFLELLERGKPWDLRKEAEMQKERLAQLEQKLGAAKTPEEKQKLASEIRRELRELSPRVNALHERVEKTKVDNWITARLQKGIDKGTVELGNKPAQLKVTNSDGSTFTVNNSKGKLELQTSGGNLSYSVKNGQIVETKNDGSERVIGSADQRNSYAMKDGALQMVDPSEAESLRKTTTLIDLGGKKQTLDPTINKGNADVKVLAGGGHLYAAKDTQDNTEKVRSLRQWANEVDPRKPGDCEPGKDGKDGRIPGPGDIFKPGGGNGKADHIDRGGSIPGGSQPADLYPRRSEQADTREYATGRTVESSISRPILETRQGNFVVSNPSRDLIPARAIERQVPLPQIAQQLLPQQINRSSEMPVNVGRQVFSENVKAALPNYYNIMPQARMEQAIQHAPGQTQAFKQALGQVQNFSRVGDLPKLQPNLLQPTQPGYHQILNNVPLSKIGAPTNQQYHFNAPPKLSGDPIAKSNSLSHYQSLMSAAPANLYKSAGLNNGIGRSLQEAKDLASKSNVKGVIGHAASGLGGQVGQHGGRGLANLISDKTPGTHTTVSDKWNPIKSIGGGSTSSGDAVPFVPISGRVGGAGAGTGARVEGGKKVEGVKGTTAGVEGGKSTAGIKTNDGIKTPEGTKTIGGSNAIDGGKKVDGGRVITSVIDGSKTITGSGNVSDAGKVDSASPQGFIAGRIFGAGNGGAAAADVKSPADAKTTADSKATAGQEANVGSQKDPGFGYTPRRTPHTVKLGETLESIARQRWGDERLADLIRTINLHRLNVTKEAGKVVLKLSAGDLLWLPSDIEADRFKKVCDIKGDGQHALTVGFSV